MAKKPRAAKTNTLGMKNKSKTAARRALKKKAKPLAKAKKKVQARASAVGKAKKAKAEKKLSPTRVPAKKVAAKPAARPMAEKKKVAPPAPVEMNAAEIENRVLFAVSKEEPAVHADPVNPTESIFHNKGKALRAMNAKYSQHARDSKRGGFNARLPGAQVGKRGK